MSRRGRNGLASRRGGTDVVLTPVHIFGSSLALWLRADLGITLNGGNVSAWADQSGKGDSNRNAVQGTAANQPAWNASDASYGGRPTLSFAGDNLVTGTWSVPLTQTCAIYVVGNTSGGGGNELFTDGLAASVNRLIVDWGGGAGSRFGIFASVYLIDTVNGNGSPHIVAGLFAGASSKIYVDNVTEKATGNAGSNQADGLTLGSGQAGVGSAPLNGKIAEIVAVQGAPTATQHAALMRYFGGRYGITVGA